MQSLCRTCGNVREVVSGKNSVFFLCSLSQSDGRYQKYPPQPVVRCDGYEVKPAMPTTFTLEVLPQTLAICRLNGDEPVPDWATGEIVSVTQTPNELSIVCPQQHVPDQIRCERGWRCLRVVGQLDLSMTGVIASLAKCLAAASISVFVISTFDTDYLLVKEDAVSAAIEALAAAGHSISQMRQRGLGFLPIERDVEKFAHVCDELLVLVRDAAVPIKQVCVER